MISTWKQWESSCWFDISKNWKNSSRVMLVSALSDFFVFACLLITALMLTILLVASSVSESEGVVCSASWFQFLIINSSVASESRKRARLASASLITVFCGMYAVNGWLILEVEFQTFICSFRRRCSQQYVFSHAYWLPPWTINLLWKRRGLVNLIVIHLIKNGNRYSNTFVILRAKRTSLKSNDLFSLLWRRLL